MTITEVTAIIQGVSAIIVSTLALLTWLKVNHVAKKQIAIETKVDVIKVATDGMKDALVTAAVGAATAKAILGEKEAAHIREGEAAVAVIANTPALPTIAVANGCNNGEVKS